MNAKVWIGMMANDVILVTSSEKQPPALDPPRAGRGQPSKL